MPERNARPPLVSCIMPTADRRRLASKAIQLFLAQDYPSKELLIVDDGKDSIEELVPADPRIRYFRCERATIGAKRNLACHRAGGAFIVHWDDDDWTADWRISYQVRALLRTGADVCGLQRLYFYDVVNDRAWTYIFRGGMPWVHGATLCYTKAFWKRNPFGDITFGEDTRFLYNGRPRLVSLRDKRFYVGMIHARNTCSKRIWTSAYVPCEAQEVRTLLGADLPDYAAAFARRTA